MDFYEAPAQNHILLKILVNFVLAHTLSTMKMWVGKKRKICNTGNEEQTKSQKLLNYRMKLLSMYGARFGV